MIALLFSLLVADPTPATAREAFAPLNPLIGSWKGTGYPEGTREERQNGFWTETIIWAWKFKGNDAWLTLEFEKGKHFSKGELRFSPKQNEFTLSLLPPNAKEPLLFTGSLLKGKLGEQILTLDRTDETAKETQRIVLTLLHSNRYLYRYESKPLNATSFTKKYQVGATKEGEPFALVPQGNECIVSGGKGSIPVSHNGKTYYDCCSGCKDAFKEDPEKWIKEWEAKNKK